MLSYDPCCPAAGYTHNGKEVTSSHTATPRAHQTEWGGSMYDTIGLGYLFSHIEHRQQTADHTKPLHNLYYKWHTIKDLVMTPLIAKDAIFRQPFSPVNTRVYTAIIPVIENTAGLICSYFLPGPRPRSSAVLCSRSYAAIT